MKKCLFCESSKESRVVEKNCDFVCGSCVSLFMTKTRAEMELSYQAACDGKMIRKATALSMFMRDKPKIHLKLSNQAAPEVQGSTIADLGIG